MGGVGLGVVVVGLAPRIEGGHEDGILHVSVGVQRQSVQQLFKLGLRDLQAEPAGRDTTGLRPRASHRPGGQQGQGLPGCPGYTPTLEHFQFVDELN